MEFKGISPYKFQKKVINDVLETDAFYYTLVTGRQIGKTLLLINLMLYFAINKSRTTILWVSPVYSQAIKVISQILDAIESASIIKEANKSEKIISLINGSRIYFRSAESPETIRGLSVEYAFIDEAQDVLDDCIFKAVMPTLTAVGKKMLVAGTPKRRNWHYVFYQRGQDPNETLYRSYTGPSSISPYVTKEFIEEQRKSLPPNIFRQEFLAEWVDGSSAVFENINESCNLTDWIKPTGKIYGGLDVGTKDDYSVLTLLDRVGQTIYIWRGRHLAYSQIVEKTVSICKKYNVELMVESNGVGDPIYEQIKKEWSRTQPFVTTNSSKNNIITKLITDMQDLELSLPTADLFPPLKQELEAFEYQYTKSGNISYSAPTGLKDDCVMSLAIANWNRSANTKKGSIHVGNIGGTPQKRIY